MGAGPDISVVIPTRGRETRLAFALEALAAQTLPAERFEVIVVRDADASPPLAASPHGLGATFKTANGVSGPTAKRNVGWRAAKAPLVAFTDDDCRPDPGWLASLLEANPGRDEFLQGRTAVDPDEADLLFGLARSQAIDGPSPWFETCNMAYPRALLERLEGFDEEFSFGGEDTDLGLRAIAAGGSRRYVDAAVVWHAVLCAPLPKTLSEQSAWETLPLVVGRHPEQRRHLFLGFFRTRSHFGVLLLVLALAFGLRRRPAVATALAAPYVSMNTRSDELRSSRALARHLLHLPARALLDAVQTGATIRHAIRHRVPMA